MCDPSWSHGGPRIASRFDCRSLEGGRAKNIPSDPRPARCTEPATQYGADNSLYRLVPTVRLRSPTGTSVFHGEFDPGSGRTLAACLTHASGATNLASARGKAANG